LGLLELLVILENNIEHRFEHLQHIFFFSA